MKGWSPFSKLTDPPTENTEEPEQEKVKGGQGNVGDENKKGETKEEPIPDAFKLVNISGYKKELKDFYEKNGIKKNYEDLLTEWA